MTQSICVLFILFYPSIHLNIRSNFGALISHERNPNVKDFFTLFPKRSSISDTIPDAAVRFQCLKGWQRFGGTCYSQSKTTSTPTKASRTCSFLLNNSQPMKIRHRSELSYLACTLKRRHSDELMIEVDSKLLKDKRIQERLLDTDWVKWQRAEKRFRQGRDAYYRWKMKDSGYMVHKQNPFETDQIPTTSDAHLQLQSTLTSTYPSTSINGKEKDGNYEDYHKEFEELSNLCHACDEIKLIELKNDSDVFILSTYLEDNKTVCSLSDVQFDQTYEHLCQYVLDSCFINDLCGKRGRCINTQTIFECSCFFLFDGPSCQALSGQGKQIIIAFLMIILIVLYILKESLKSLGNSIKKLLVCCCTQQSTRTDVSNTREHKNLTESKDIHWYLIGGLTIIFFAALLIIPAVFHVTLFEYKEIDQLSFNLPTKASNRMITRCKRHPLIQLVFSACGLLAFITTCVILSMKQRRQDRSFFDCLNELLLPFKPFDIKNRYATASVFCIAVFEVLSVLDYVLIDLSKLWGPGVLAKLFESVPDVLIIVMKYYPILASLRQNDLITRVFACIYFISNFTYTIFRQVSCMDIMPPSENASTFSETKLDMNFIHRAFIYGLIRNVPYFFLLAYTAAEITLRFGYDSICKHNERSPETTLLNQSVLSNVNKESRCSCVRSFLEDIYPWEPKFRFITISLCTYGTAFIFLYHTTCTLIFHYFLGRTSYISFVIYAFQSMLNIELDPRSLHWEVIVSGTITVVFFSYQILVGMKNCKKNVKKPNQDTVERNSITEESIQYLKLSTQCLVGGYFVVFHLVLFICITIGLIPSQFGSVEPLISFILTLLFLYMLQLAILRVFYTFNTSQRTDETENGIVPKQNVKNLVYLTFVVFIFIANLRITAAVCVLCLVKISAVHIISATEIDCSRLGQPTEVIEHPHSDSETSSNAISDTEEDHHNEAIEITPRVSGPSDGPDNIPSPVLRDNSTTTFSYLSKPSVPFSRDCNTHESSSTQQQKYPVESANAMAINKTKPSSKPRRSIRGASQLEEGQPFIEDSEKNAIPNLRRFNCRDGMELNNTVELKQLQPHLGKSEENDAP